jgi:uncharacterized membrane protein YeaQ/YmgE (transglycosylase-associated protein family)
MQIILFIVIGFFAGLIARAILPGKHQMGMIMTTLLGIAGSFLGGFVASFFSKEDVSRFHSTGIIGSIIGALVILAIVTYVGKHRHAPEVTA